MSKFKHPLARDAKVWPSSGTDGLSKQVLVVITTLELDANHKKYKADLVDRLSDAARTWVREHALEADSFMLIARPKEW